MPDAIVSFSHLLTPGRMRWLGAALIPFLLFSSASGNTNMDSHELYAKLRRVMDETNAIWKSLPHDKPRNPDVSESICSLVSIQLLQEIQQSMEFDVEYLALPNGDIGVPPNSERWTIFGNTFGFSREVLTVYTGHKFCLALYNHIN